MAGERGIGLDRDRSAKAQKEDNMLRVVSDKPKDTIDPSKITPDMLVVCKSPKGNLYKLQGCCKDMNYFWANLLRGDRRYLDPVEKDVPELVQDALDHGAQVFVLKDAGELEDWLDENA
jgi:hypothetical protein